MTPDRYGEKFAEHSEQSYRVADLDCYERDNKLTYAAIWEKNRPGGAGRRFGRCPPRLATNWNKYSDQGMRIVDIEICPANSGGGTQYAAVWRENDDRYDWAGRGQADRHSLRMRAMRTFPALAPPLSVTAASSFVAERDLPTGQGVAAHCGTIYRLASVAKAVTGTLAYDLEQAGLSISTTAPIRPFPGWERSTPIPFDNCCRCLAVWSTTRLIARGK